MLQDKRIFTVNNSIKSVIRFIFQDFEIFVIQIVNERHLVFVINNNKKIYIFYTIQTKHDYQSKTSRCFLFSF